MFWISKESSLWSILRAGIPACLALVSVSSLEAVLGTSALKLVKSGAHTFLM